MKVSKNLFEFHKFEIFHDKRTPSQNFQSGEKS